MTISNIQHQIFYFPRYHIISIFHIHASVILFFNFTAYIGTNSKTKLKPTALLNLYLYAFFYNLFISHTQKPRLGLRKGKKKMVHTTNPTRNNRLNNDNDRASVDESHEYNNLNRRQILLRL